MEAFLRHIDDVSWSQKLPSGRILEFTVFADNTSSLRTVCLVVPGTGSDSIVFQYQGKWKKMMIP